MKQLIIPIIIFVILFWIGVKLNRWINGTGKISRQQKNILKELEKHNKKR